MGRLAEVNQSTKISLQLFDGATDRFPRFRIYNAAGVEQVAAPFNSPIDPAHVAGGLYNAQFTPDAEGEYTITKKVYSNVGRTTLDKKFNEVSESLVVRSVDQDLTTVLTRVPALVETKAQADARQVILVAEHDASQAQLTTIDSLVDAILVDTGTSIPALIAALNDIDIADVQTAMTNQNYTSARGNLLSNLDAAMTSRASQVSLDAAKAVVDAILVDTDTTIPGLIAALNDLDTSDVQAALTSQGYTGVRATNLDNLNATVSSRATQTSVDGIQNNTNFVATVPDTFERPDSGSDTQKVYVRLFDGTGIPEDPDSNVMTLRVEHSDGTVIYPQANMTRDGVGQFSADVDIDSTDTLGQYVYFFGYTENLQAIEQIRTSRLVETNSTVDSIEGKVDTLITTIGVPTLADVSADINSRESETSANTRETTNSGEHDATIAAIAALNDIDQAGVQAAMTAQGYLASRAVKIDQLDVAVSSRESETDANSRANQTQADIAALENMSITDAQQAMTNQGYTSGRAPNLDRLDVTVSSRQSESDAASRAAADIAEHDTTQDLINDFSGAAAAEIADAVWDEPQNQHLFDGSMGKSLDDARKQGVTTLTPMDLDNIADSVWDEDLGAHNLGDSASLTLKHAEAEASAAKAAALSVPTNPLRVDDVRLNNLDVPISTREAETDAVARAAMSAKESTVTAVKAKTDQLGFDGALIRSKAETVTDKTAYSLTVPEKADIADRVWDETLSEHQSPGSTGEKLGIGTPTKEQVASQVWDTAAASHTSPTSFGGKLNETRIKVASNEASFAELLDNRLTTTRAGKIDFLDQLISSLETEVSASARQVALIAQHSQTQSDIADVHSAVDNGDPDIAVIRSLLESASIGLAAIKNETDLASKSDELAIVDVKVDSVVSSLAAAFDGLTALRTTIDGVQTDLDNPTDGLGALKTAIDSRATQGSVDNVPTAAEIRDSVWDKAAAAPHAAGSLGERVADNLNAEVATRAEKSDVTAVEDLSTAIKALLENGSYGLNALLLEINENEGKIDTAITDIAGVDTNVDDTRAAILAAIGALIDGTPTILAELSVIKGAGWSSATDTLENIRDAIGTGSATVVKQDEILAGLVDIKGAGWAAGDNLKDLKDDTVQAIADIASTKGEVTAGFATVENDLDIIDGKATGALTRLDNPVFGLAKAKDDRDLRFGTVDFANAGILAAIGSLDAALAADLTALAIDIANVQTAVDSNDPTAQITKLNGIIALLTGADGLAILKGEILSNRNQEGLNAASYGERFDDIDQGLVDVDGNVTSLKGGGWDGSQTLQNIFDAVGDLDTEHDTLGTVAKQDEIILKLHQIADGNTGDFDAATDALNAIGSKVGVLQGFEAGGS